MASAGGCASSVIVRGDTSGDVLARMPTRLAASTAVSSQVMSEFAFPIAAAEIPINKTAHGAMSC